MSRVERKIQNKYSKNKICTTGCQRRKASSKTSSTNTSNTQRVMQKMDKFQYVPMVRRETVHTNQNRVVPSVQTEVRNMVKIK